MKIQSLVKDIYDVLLELEKPVFNKPFEDRITSSLRLHDFHTVEFKLRSRTGTVDGKPLKYMTLTVDAERCNRHEYVTSEMDIQRFESFSDSALEAGAMAAGRQIFKALRRYFLDNPEQPIVIHDFLNRQRSSKVLSVELGKAIARVRKSDEEVMRIRLEDKLQCLKIASGFGVYKSWKLESLKSPEEVVECK